MAQKKHDLDYLLAQARRIAEHREANAEKEIRKAYKALLKDLQAYIGDVHARYAVDGSLSFAALQRAGYDARFLEEIEARIIKVSPKAAKALHELVEDTYKLAYESMVQGVLAQEVDGLNDAFAEAIAITPEQIKKVVKNPIMEVALEKNHKDIIYEIKQAVAVSMMNGDRYDTTARRIAELLDSDKGAYKRAVRIARTESHRVREAGNHDAALAVDEELQKGTSGLRMCKVWKTMKDERVRPQRRRKGKKGWSTKMGNGPNHMKMDGQTVLENEDFDLLDGYTTPAPGQSRIAGHDINCRCYASRRMLTDDEYFKATGKHFPGFEGLENTGKSAIIKPKISAECQAIIDELENDGVEYVEVAKHAKKLTGSEIISALAGGDMTSGSCASVGIAYIGQKHGLNVLDFRGGKSMDYFSRKTTKVKMFEALGATPIEENSAKSNLTNGKRILSKMVKGKEYYLSVGRHAAVVRLNDEGVPQYLELQSSGRNGWQNFTKDVRDTLKWRFGCSQSSSYWSSAYLTDIDLFPDNDDFRTLLGYINTNESEQRRGKHGTIK